MSSPEIKYCPESCDSLYGKYCTMRVKDIELSAPYYRLNYTDKLPRRYYRRESCPLKYRHGRLM